jgi:Lon protease-like protein
MVQPLHIFEDRYREMISRCIERDEPFVLCTLQPGSEALYETKLAPLERLGCLAQITVHKKLDDGRYMLIVKGLSRVAIVGEQPTEDPFRIGLLAPCVDHYPDPPEVDRRLRRQQLLDSFFNRFPDLKHNEALSTLLQSELTLGTLCDLLAYSARLSGTAMYDVLTCLNVDARSSLVLQQIQSLKKSPKDSTSPGPTSASTAEPQKTFPPPFSLN